MTLSLNEARQQIETLIQRYNRLDDHERKAMTEANVVRQFVDPLLSALGWPIEEPQRYKYELYTEAGRPDITLLPAGGHSVFVEAKRFGLIAELAASDPAITAGWQQQKARIEAAAAFNNMNEFIADKRNLIYVRLDSISRFSPTSLSVLEFQTQEDADIVSAIYNGHPLLGQELGNVWNIKLNREFDVANDRKLLNQHGSGLVFYEGKMVHQYDADFAPPSYWIAEQIFETLPLIS